MQLAIHVVQIRNAREQKSHWDKTNKGDYHFKVMYAFCLSGPGATFALQLSGFVPREWLAAKGLVKCRGSHKGKKNALDPEWKRFCFPW